MDGFKMEHLAIAESRARRVLFGASLVADANILLCPGDASPYIAGSSQVLRIQWAMRWRNIRTS